MAFLDVFPEIFVVNGLQPSMTSTQIVLNNIFQVPFIQILLLDFLFLLTYGLQHLLRHGDRSKRQFISDFLQKSLYFVKFAFAPKLDNYPAMLNRSHIMVNSSLSLAHAYTDALFSDWLPWRINSPDDKHPIYVNFSTECQTQHFHVTMTQPTSHLSDDPVLLMQEGVVNKLGATH